MRTIGLVALFLALPPAAEVSARPLTLADAVELAMRVDPLLAEARIAKDRSKLGLLRAQLDRISLKIDGSLAEQWSKSNIGGATLNLPQCTLPMGLGVLPFDRSTCQGLNGTVYSQSPSPVQSPELAQGLSNLSVNLQLPLFAGFRVDGTVKRQARLDDAAGVSIRQSRRDLALGTARAYWAVRRLGLLYDVQQASVVRLRDSEAVTRSRVAAGLAPPIDHNRATLRRLQTEASLADLAGQLKEATVQLAVALGTAPDLVLTDGPEVPDAPPPAVEILLADAHGSRSEVLYAKLQSEAGRQAVRIARSSYYPQLTAQMLFQYGNTAFISGAGFTSLASATSTNPFAGMSGNLTLGIGLSYNFFDTLHSYTTTRDAEYDLARLAQEERRALRLVETDVRAAHAKVNHLFSERAPLLVATDVARDNATILEARYKNGDALVIELLDAQVALVDSERALADVTAQLKLAWLELDAALGSVVGSEARRP